MKIESFITFSNVTALIIGAFIISFIGYALGSIKIKGVRLGAAAIFLVSLLFGYLFTQPILNSLPVLKCFFIADGKADMFADYRMLEMIGLVLFVTAVGYMAGPNFFRNIKQNAKSYVPLSFVLVATGTVLTVIFAMLPGIGADYSTGIMSGAMTSTPAFSASKQVAENEGLVSLGHAVAYPFGVVGIVLFVQIIPRLLKVDMEKERALISDPNMNKKQNGLTTEQADLDNKKRFTLDTLGLGAFAVAVVLGIIIGAIKIPLTAKGFDGPCFSLGNTGGPLIAALILGHFGRIGRLSLKMPEATLKVFREFGLMLFLVGAGVEGGVELVSQIGASGHGAMLILYGFIAGVIMTVIPLLVGYFFVAKVFRLPFLNGLGAITGGRTSTPALGTLINVSGTEDVASAYAATYPVSLVLIVLASNLIETFMA